jgi:hypothetical protein
MTRVSRIGRAVVVLVAGVGAASGLYARDRSTGRAAQSASFVVATPWAGHGTWLAADLHAHTTFSDGRYTPAEVVNHAVGFGCRAVGITDHSDDDLGGASPEYAEAIRAVRAAHPGVVLPAGIEWNVPPWGGDEHAVVLLPSGANEWRVLAEFKRRFDDLHRPLHDPALATEALRWLAANGAAGGIAPVVIDNHPSRKKAPDEAVPAMMRWRQANDLVIGFEGGPGHQRAPVIGSYRPEVPTIDRWDPVVAEVGGAWDRLLQQGLNVWGAEAVSDFHDDSPGPFHDYWPCEFAETWLYVPESTTAGVLRAARAGAFFGVHGHIARAVTLGVSANGLPRPAMAGETIAVPAGMSVTVTLSLEVPARDAFDQPNQVDAIELIAVSRDGARVFAKRDTRPPDAAGLMTVTAQLTVPSSGVVVRARGRRAIAGGPDLMFYTNPIRILTANR